MCNMTSLYEFVSLTGRWWHNMRGCDLMTLDVVSVAWRDGGENIEQS